MSLLSVLKSIGKDLGHVGTWIEDAAKIVQPVIAAIDPPIGAIITSVENVIGDAQAAAAGPLTAASLQALVQAVTTIETMKAQIAAATKAPAVAVVPAT